MFLFKKIVAPLLFPVPLCTLMLLAGLALLWFTRRQRAGKIVVTAGVALLTLLSYGPVSGRLLGPVERRHPPILSAQAVGREVKWVAVLGGGSSSDPDLPPGRRLSEASLARLVEGLRLHRSLPGSKLLLSGGSVFGSGSDAEAMRALALDLGARPEDIVLDADSLDTEAQAVNVGRMVGGEGFFLVTSASHMRRAVALFTKAGTRPIPAPAHHIAQRGRGLSPGDFYPSAGGLRMAETAVYEWLGLFWAMLRGRV